MADGIIQRIVRLVLDRGAAAQTEKDAKKTLGGVEGGMAKLKKAALGLGAALVAALSLRALVNFARESIRLAAEQEVRWKGLASAVEAAGHSFEELEPSLRAAASAFQDASTHGDDEYAETLAKLTAMTGDLTASTHNMGLIANVAARYFKGELSPAVDLVGRVMNGNIGTLGRMGIVVKDAQEGLEVLANRSLNAASDRAATFSGKVAQINGLWGDFREEVGMSITSNEDMISSLDSVKGALQVMVLWIQNNGEALDEWTSTGIRWAVEGLDALLRTLLGLGAILIGSFRTTLAIGLRGLILLVDGFILASDIGNKFFRLIGARTAADAGDAFVDRMRAMTRAVKDWTDETVIAGALQVRRGAGRFTRTILSSIPSVGVGEMDTPAPMLAAGGMAEDEEEEEKEKADPEEAHRKRMKAAGVLSELLGEDFDLLAARAASLNTVLTALADGGVAAGDARMQGYAEELREVNAAIAAAEETTDAVAAALEAHKGRLAASVIMGRALGDEYDALGVEAASLMTVMQALADEGVSETDDRFASLTERLRLVREAMGQTAVAFDAGAIAADFMGEAVGAMLSEGVGPHAAQRSKVNALEAVEMLVRAGTSLLFGNPVGAAKFALAAKEHGALAVAWGALAAGSGGFSSGGGRGASGGTALAGGRTAGSGVAAAATPAGPQVSIFLQGPGFHALQPHVQQVVYGAMQEARERFGPNVRIRTAP